MRTRSSYPPAETIPTLDPRFRPQEVIGAGALGRLAFEGADLAQLRQALVGDVQRRPYRAGTLLDLSLVTLFAGQPAAALELQRRALAQQAIFRVAGLEPPPPPRLRVLALVAPGDLMANTPLEFILTGSGVILDLLYLRPGQPLPTVMPDHDVAFTAVSQSAENDPILRRLIPLARAWPRPVLNDPARLLWLARDLTAPRLYGAPGLCVAAAYRFSRAGVEALAAGADALARAGLDLPCIIRPLDAHAGHGLEKIETGPDFLRYLNARPAVADFFVSSFVDYRSADGQFRKYRIVFIDGRPFLCHLAIGRDWMVHYVAAGMENHAANRAEEARAMESFDHDFARRHAAAFAALRRGFGLDYFGIDCAETRDGQLLIFEVASAMVIHTMDSPRLHPYKPAQMQRVFAAFHRLLDRAAGRAPAGAIAGSRRQERESRVVGSLACR